MIGPALLMQPQAVILDTGETRYLKSAQRARCSAGMAEVQLRVWS